MCFVLPYLVILSILDLCFAYSSSHHLTTLIKPPPTPLTVYTVGSGKTLGFMMPALSMMIDNTISGTGKGPRVLVIAPTRELAIQSSKVCEEALSISTQLNSVVVYGGQPKHIQAKLLRAKPDVLVATPGRLLDFCEGKQVDLSGVKYFVLDEADRMLDMGFEKEVRRIVTYINPTRQTLMFSATWPEEIRQLGRSFMKKNAKQMLIGSDKLKASATIEQFVEVVQHNEKEYKLEALLRKHHTGDNRIIVFALYKKEAARLTETLSRKGFKVAGIHGDMNQAARENSISKFKSGASPILVATDVAARGLDIKNVEMVINNTFPLTIEDYVHRIGRTGRAGAKGLSHTFFTENDKGRAGELQNVLRAAGVKVPASLAAFGNTVKKKEHKLYGNHFGSGEPMKKATKVTFDSDSE